MKDGEGISQKTFMHDPWPRTMIEGLTGRREGMGLRGGGQRGKSGDNYNSIKNKK